LIFAPSGGGSTARIRPKESVDICSSSASLGNVREWRGETHDVLVLEDGFQWRGQRWRSLSAIAREISGTHWSGPRFFGLQAKAEAAEEVGSETGAGEARDA
jgi:hypothetical protein